MNPISSKMLTGSVGELLVQIRLLQHGVQAAPPVEDSGNDLIAVNGDHFRAVSVRTTTSGTYNKPQAARTYHVLAVVHLLGEGESLHLDQTLIYLVPRERVHEASSRCAHLDQYLLTRDHVERLFGPLGDLS